MEEINKKELGKLKEYTHRMTMQVVNIVHSKILNWQIFWKQVIMHFDINNKCDERNSSADLENTQALSEKYFSFNCLNS